MKIQFISLEIQKLFVDEIKVAKSRFKLPLLQETFPGFNDVPMILELIKTSIIPHEHPQNIFSDIWLLTFHEILHTNVVHVAIGEVHLSSLVNCLQTFNVVVQFVLDCCFDQIKLCDCAGMTDGLCDVLVGSGQSFIAKRIVLSKQIQTPQIF